MLNTESIEDDFYYRIHTCISTVQIKVVPLKHTTLEDASWATISWSDWLLATRCPLVNWQRNPCSHV